MLRRFAIVLVAWLGLAWAVSPALACARGAADRDCCPEGVTSPCKGEEPSVDLSSLAALCCAGASTASPVVSAEASRTTHVQPRDSGSPDPIVTFAWFATLTPFPDAAPLPDRGFASSRTDATLTYLRTRRLRL